jgi:hypothetical protein
LGTRFGLTQSQAIALMGAHSLGKVSRANSGFTSCLSTPTAGSDCPAVDVATSGQWVTQNTRLTSDYFRQALAPWRQISLAASGALSNLFVWVIPTPNQAGQQGQIMLNVDIGMVRALAAARADGRR